MSNLSYWSKQNRPKLRQVLDLQSRELGRLGKYFQVDTIDAMVNLVKTYSETSSVALVNGTSLVVNILIATKNNEIYRIHVQRPTVSGHKNLNEWLNTLCDTEVHVSQINDRIIWM